MTTNNNTFILKIEKLFVILRYDHIIIIYNNYIITLIFNKYEHKYKYYFKF